MIATRLAPRRASMAGGHFQYRYALLLHHLPFDPCTLQELEPPVTSVSISATPGWFGLASGPVRTVKMSINCIQSRRHALARCANPIPSPGRSGSAFCDSSETVILQQQSSVWRDSSARSARVDQLTQLAEPRREGLAACPCLGLETVTEARGKMGAPQISPEPGVSSRVPNGQTPGSLYSSVRHRLHPDDSDQRRLARPPTTRMRLPEATPHP